MPNLFPKITPIPDALQSTYQKHLLDEKIMLTRLLCVLGGVLLLASVFVDILAMASIRVETNIVRFLLLAIKVGVFWTTYQTFFPKYATLLQHTVCLFPAMGISFVIYLSSPHDTGHYLYFCFLLIIVMVLFSWTHISLTGTLTNTLVIATVYTFALYLNTRNSNGPHNFLEIYVPSVYAMIGATTIGLFYKLLKDQHSRQSFLHLHSLTEAAEKQSYMANHDALTGLTNRRYAERNIKQDLVFAKENNLHNLLFVLDLNKFKAINDEHGHHAGDTVLKEVAARLKRHTEFTTEHFSRLGGDEFVISMLVEEISPGYIETLSKNIKLNVIKPIQITNDKEIGIGVSIGVACYPEDGEDYSSLMRTADRRMYEDKKTQITPSVHASNVVNFGLANK